MAQRQSTGGADAGAGLRGSTKVFDLEDRLLDFAARILRLVEHLPRTSAGKHVAAQILRSGTSPLPNHGEAQAAESPKDFQHKLRVCLKELRETYRWLKLIMRVPLIRPPGKVKDLLSETDELVRMFVASIRTSEGRSRRTQSGH